MTKKTRKSQPGPQRRNTMDVDVRWLEEPAPPAVEAPAVEERASRGAEPRRNNTIPVDPGWLVEGGEEPAPKSAPPSLPRVPLAPSLPIDAPRNVPSPRIRNRGEPPSLPPLPPPPAQAARARGKIPPPLPREDVISEAPPARGRASKPPRR